MENNNLLKRLNKGEVLVFDGATGTYLQNNGLAPGACPELMNIEHPKTVQNMASIYFDSGSDIVLTNSFGARHANSVNKSIKHSGRIDEFGLPIESKGYFNIKEILGLLLPGLRMLIKKRSPSPIHHKNPNQSKVKNIFKNFEDNK